MSDDALVNEMQNILNNAKSAGKDALSWHELPQVIRAFIKARYGTSFNSITINALYALMQEYKKELEATATPEPELTEEEEREYEEAIKAAEAEFHDPTIVGSEDYKETVKELAEMLLVFEDKAIRPGLVAEMLLTHFHFATMSDTEEIYLYTRGVYKPAGERFIKRIVQDVFSKAGKLGRLSTHFVSEVMDHVRRATLSDRRKFDQEPWVLNLRNGLLDLYTLELKPHDPAHLSTIQLPVEWNPKAKCERWDQFISEIVDEKDALVLQEFAGYILLRDCRFQKALMLTGSGSNGKSTFLNVIIKMLGEHNCSFISLQELTTNRFATSNLYSKLANIYDDLEPKALSNTGIFKILVSGGEIQAEKKFKNAFKFKNHAKLIFSANKVPSTADTSRAFFRRWIIINFPNTFKGDDADPHLEDKLSTPQCLSYVLKWAVEGLKRLLEQGRFSYEEDYERIEDMYLRASNPAYAFIQDRVIEDPEAAVTKDELYRAFIEYCKQNKIPTVSKRTFGEHVKRWCKVQEGWTTILGQRKRAWRDLP